MPGPPRLLGPVRWLARRGHDLADSLRNRRRAHSGVATLLCFGDSNTWGYMPGTGFRLPRQARWPGVVESRLGGRVTVLEAGRNGRVTGGGLRRLDGLLFLQRWLRNHSPPDFAAIMLGTNDCLSPVHRPIVETAANLGELANLLLECPPFSSHPRRLLLICPSPIKPIPGLGLERAASLSEQLAAELRQVAARKRCHFVDAGILSTIPPADGLHLGPASHRRLGEVVAEWLLPLLPAAARETEIERRCRQAGRN